MKLTPKKEVRKSKAPLLLIVLGLTSLTAGLWLQIESSDMWREYSLQVNKPDYASTIPSSISLSEVQVPPKNHHLSSTQSSNEASVKDEWEPVEEAEYQTPDVRSLFGFAQLVQSIQTTPDVHGRFLKVGIYNTDFKYPLIRVAEQWNSTHHNFKRSAMVADHLIVEWTEEANPEEIAEFLGEHQAQIRDLDPDSNTSLISFDGYDPRSLGRMLKTFRESSLVKSVDPDYLTTNR